MSLIRGPVRVEVFYLPGSPACNRTFAWLEAHGTPHRRTNPDETERHWLKLIGCPAVFPTVIVWTGDRYHRVRHLTIHGHNENLLAKAHELATKENP